MVIDIAPASAKAATAPEKNRHQKNRHPAIRPAVFQSRPAPGQTASSPNSRPHQLVGLWTDANQQLPPETVQLAALETAQTRFPPPRRPYPAPPGAGTYQQPGQAPGQPAPGAMPGQLPAQTYPGQAPAGTFPRQAPAQTFPGQVPARTFPGQVPTQTFPGQVPASVIPPQQPVRSLDQASEMIEKLFYVRGLFGGIFARESDLSGSGNNNTTEFDAGFSLSGAVGADMKNNFRAEAEFIYTNSSVKSIAGTANSTTLNTGNVTGSLITYSGMGNLVYEIPQQSLFTPFVFAGAGVTGLFLDGVNNSGQALYNDSDFVFAMQFGAGVSMPFDDRITLEASYRFFNTFDAELADASGDPTTVEFSSHNFLFGARYAF
jgi:opacity protein-like surface antigen